MGISAPSRDGPYFSRAAGGGGGAGDTDVHIQVCATQRKTATGVVIAQGCVPGAGSFRVPRPALGGRHGYK